MDAYVRVFGVATLLLATSLFGKIVSVYNSSPFTMKVEIAFCQNSNRSKCGDTQKFNLAPGGFNAMEIQDYTHYSRAYGANSPKSVDYCVSSIKATAPAIQATTNQTNAGQQQPSETSITRDLFSFCATGKNSGNPL